MQGLWKRSAAPTSCLTSLTTVSERLSHVARVENTTLREGLFQLHFLPRGSEVLCTLTFPVVFLISCFQGRVASPLETITSPLRVLWSQHQCLLLSSFQLSLVPMGWLFGSCGGRANGGLHSRLVIALLRGTHWCQSSLTQRPSPTTPSPG